MLPWVSSTRIHAIKSPALGTYVALLRGINVGGNNLIPMAALTKTFEKLGVSSVQTYIQSGNVLFQTGEADPRELEVRIERALTKAYEYEARVVVRSREEMAGVIAGLPRAWTPATSVMRYNVLFLRHEIDSNAILEGLSTKSDVEQIAYRPGVLYWSARTSDLGRTMMIKLSSKPIYKQITVRNLNTTKKIFELMKEMP
jgi:uncharacterized protein (DUF1697 family)